MYGCNCRAGGGNSGVLCELGFKRLLTGIVGTRVPVLYSCCGVLVGFVQCCNEGGLDQKMIEVLELTFSNPGILR